ncbi:MAG: phosphoethanolamine transferase, partial [Mesorhizobium sp.]|nr:phosphoethanolamine transferase [Mesorhizobium sp.]
TAEDPDIFYRSKSFVSAFRDVGFMTYWISNQGTQRTAVGNQIALAMGEADETRSTNFGFWNSVLDGALLPELDQVLADPAPRKLIVLHTLGSHTNYTQRFPADWTLDPSALPVREAHGYKDLSDAETQIIDAYDKTVSYTDWFLHQIIERHRSLKTDGAVMYFSDHGQRLYDDGDRQKGHGFPDFKRQDAEIPLLLWLPDVFAQRYPDRYAAIKRNAAKPVSTANLATSLLDLAGIEVDAMERSASFFGSGYRPPPRKVLTTDGRIVPQ